MDIKKRTFEAAKFPKGSEERAKLNLDALTSEYMTSYKYCIVNDAGKSEGTFRSKSEAENKLTDHYLKNAK